jgi:hypothetical protein
MAKTPKPFPKVSIIDRRMQSPYGVGTVPITLKTPGQWAIRIVYSKLRAGHIYSMTQQKGWVFVEPSELDSTPEEYGFTAKDNRLVRGDHGEEVLMMMPLEDFKRIQQAKTDYNNNELGKKKMQQSAAQAAAKQLGDQAGDGVFNAFKHGDVVDTRGLDPELESESA